jgi:large subunit ribosomal protein L10
MKKSEKSLFVDNLTEELKAAKSVVLINYTGIGVKMQQNLQKKLKAAGASMVVVKNTLLKRASEAAKIDEKLLTSDILSGQTALIISKEDPISPITVLGSFVKEFELPQLKVGIVEGKFQDKEALIKLSNLPGRDVLLSQVLGALMAPSYGLVGTLKGNMQKLVYILQTKAKGGE